ncbi:cobyrinate a,c-diamide synthase [Sulfurospirillum barnesii]|uniref:Cobyrinic acid a,c-diamide synthase n=1 Tax=Sulfurospirillum barnesii (strain ATCC 700032 / DSM 10660 / SES-3) TaxID=760154 RepID=I3XZN2_SULBS|nr:cobyrinate a,c-diamide synthase [Sulfurospirillum barnesii]AFL69406.1 cobyrinic acid a,c-diamide synthase [Sulfurospirillum barnesii SES-3]
MHLCISATASHSGKTLLSTALLHRYRGTIRPYKIGPDFIDPHFHAHLCGTPSINLDSYMMNEAQVQWLYAHYNDKKSTLIEGVMGYYDGEDMGCSTYGITALLGVATLMILDAKGSYITLSAIVHGLKTYKPHHTIKAIVLNHIGSLSHYERIKAILEHDHPEIAVVGWIKKELKAIPSTHLGLDLTQTSLLDSLSDDVLEHIDLALLEQIAQPITPFTKPSYPFEAFAKTTQKLALVYDENFSFLYHDNLCFLQEVFQEVRMVDASKDEAIPDDVDAVYICGGYVETPQAYAKLQKAERFKASLCAHAKSKKVYAECAGLLYLGNKVDDKAMSALLDVDFTLEKRPQRLGYYHTPCGVKGHAFHYTKTCDTSLHSEPLIKASTHESSSGSWQKGGIFGTYLHTLFRAHPTLIQERLV